MVEGTKTPSSMTLATMNCIITIFFFFLTVENENHCDFIHLRELLFIECLAELVEITHIRHYHDYRASQLRKDGRPPSILECDEEYDRRIEDARKSISERLQRKDEEIRQNFVQLARHQELALRKKEEKVCMRHRFSIMIVLLMIFLLS
jgi:septin family protein